MTTQPTYDAIILGAGFGGLGQGAEFVRAGINNFLILEKAEEIGGVWRDNDYPGAACDTQTPIYCYSYFLNIHATRLFAPQHELLAYLKALTTEYDLGGRIRLGQEITSARWHAGSSTWTISTASGDEYRTRSFVPAWGQLSAPALPHLTGLDSFSGDWFHSSTWRHDLDLAGKRVASIGNAATAVQYVPEIAPIVERLTVFQRSANYILPREQRLFTPDERKSFLDDTTRYEALRNDIHDLREAGFERTRLHSGAAEEGVQQALAHLTAQVADPELRAALVPDYEFGCERILRSDDYYPALSRPNVDLVTTPIEAITPDGIRLATGAEVEVDVIIFATGFKSQAFQGNLRIEGREGVDLSDRWGSAPEAYLGMAIDGFPNLFVVYGPNTNLNHNSVVSMLEAQHRYIAQAVRYIASTPNGTLEVDPTVLHEFNHRVQSELKKSAFAAECSSWYKNSDGRVINNWCGTVEEYRTETRSLQLSDYTVSS